jgi:hypothetical protein
MDDGAARHGFTPFKQLKTIKTNHMQLNTRALEFHSILKKNSNFFEISERPVRFEDPFQKNNFSYYPHKKVVINNNDREGISIVRSEFLTIKHEDAFDLGVQLFEMMFGITPQVHRETLNPKGTDYSVDLISENCKIIIDRNGYRFSGNADLFNLRDNDSPMPILEESTNIINRIAGDFRDEYYPFIRVNNYLREGHSFRIELGYYRYRCSNGMMMGQRTKLTFVKSYLNTSLTRMRAQAFDQFALHKTHFMDMAEKLWRLLSMPISRAQIRLVSFDIFQKEIIKKNMADRQKLQLTLNDLVDKYVSEIGENLNAALNVATEFSKLLEGHRIHLSNLQTMATQWMEKVTKKRFDLDRYLRNLKGIEERVLHAQEIEEPEEWER